jgi:tRNA-dihydrouridine synthase
MIHSHNFDQSQQFGDMHLDVYKPDSALQITKSGRSALEGLEWDDFYERNPHISSLDELVKNQWGTYREGTRKNENDALIVQLAGNDPTIISRVARNILERTNASNGSMYDGPVSGIDINCGCPQGIARKGRYGAFLMEESVTTVCDLLSTLRKDLPSNVGVSAKIRIPESKVDLKDRIQRLVDTGADLITVHGRTLKENKTRVRQCDWDAIAYAVEVARDHSGVSDFPIIANGGIEFPSDIQRCLSYTKASAVMSSESLLENPGLFQISAEDETVVDPENIFLRQIGYCHEYLDLCVISPPLPGSLGKEGGSFNCIRGHLFKILYRYLEEQPDLREMMGHSKQTTSIQHAREIINELERRYSEVMWTNIKSSNHEKSWYRRHRDSLSLIRIRGQKVSSDLNDLDLDQKKKLLRERIRKLKESKAGGVTF